MKVIGNTTSICRRRFSRRFAARLRRNLTSTGPASVTQTVFDTDPAQRVGTKSRSNTLVGMLWMGQVGSVPAATTTSTSTFWSWWSSRPVDVVLHNGTGGRNFPGWVGLQGR